MVSVRIRVRIRVKVRIGFGYLTCLIRLPQPQHITLRYGMTLCS